MKRLLSVLLLITIFASATLLSACSGLADRDDDEILPTRTPPAPPSEGLEYELKSDRFRGSYYVVTGMGTCTDTLVVIPDTYNGQPVNGIAAGAFSARSTGEEASPVSFGKIGSSASKGIVPLSSVSILPLNDATEPEDTTAELQITDIFIPDSITEIGDEAFLDCENLATIDTTRLVSMIGTDAFKNTAFYMDESNWVDGVLYLENYLVDLQDGFKGTLTVREGTLHIADRALAGHMGITEVILPSSIRVIGNYAFTDCLNLVSVNLDHPGIQIGNYAFAGCVSLESVKISTDDAPSEPDGGMPQLSIVQPGTNVEDLFGSSGGTLSGSIGGGTISGSMGSGSIVTGTFTGTTMVFASLSTFAQQSTLDPNFIYSGKVGSHAFDGCSSLTSVSFGKNVGQINGSAFASCTSLVSIDMSNISIASKNGGSYVVTPGSFSFSSEVSLSSTFDKCSSLTSVVLPEGVTSMAYTFEGCTALTSFTIPEGVNDLTGTFRGCTALTSVSLPSTLTTMHSTFRGCTALEAVTIPSSVKTLGINAFRDCKSIDSLYIPDSVTKIDELAFLGMKNDVQISIGTGVTHIGADAASMLYSVTYRGTMDQWNQIDLDANWMGNRQDSSIAIYCIDGTIGEEPPHDPNLDKDDGGTPSTPPSKPETPIPEWISEIEGVILSNGVIYFRYSGRNFRYSNNNFADSPISFDELKENLPAGAHIMTERELADVFEEKVMEIIRKMVDKK